MKGSTFKRCGCREELPDGKPGKSKPLGDRCPALGKSSHGSWFYRADIGPDPLTGKRREQRKGGFRNAKEAQSALAQVVAAVSTGEHRHDERLTVGEWLTAWLARKVEDGQNDAHGSIRPSTAVMYRTYVEGTLIPQLGQFRLGELRHSHVERMLRDLHAGGKGDATIRGAHAVLRSALSQAKRARLVSENVAQDVKGLPERGKSRPSPWEPEQLGRFLDATASHRFGPLFEFLAFSGLRRGEACALRWSDVVLEDRALNVRSSLIQVGPKWIEGKPKTASGERRVDLGERTVGLLLMVQLAQDEDRKRWGATYRDNGRVFAREDGADLSPEAVTKTFRRLATSTGLRTMRLHDLRHVAASQYERRRVPASPHGHPRSQLRRNEPALRAPVRHHHPRRVRTSSRPGQDTHRGPARTLHNAVRRTRRPGLAHHRNHQDRPRRRVLPPRACPRIMLVGEHLRTLPKLSHHQWLHPGADPATRPGHSPGR